MFHVPRAVFGTGWKIDYPKPEQLSGSLPDARPVLARVTSHLIPIKYLSRAMGKTVTNPWNEHQYYSSRALAREK